MAVLLTGGTGYIGSHTAVEMIESGYDVILADNLYNSEESVVERIGMITGTKPLFYNCDISDRDQLDRIFSENEIEAVIHFAGYKAVAESVEMPLMYYRNNLDTTLTLLEVMKEHGVGRIVFSSSATVYGSNNKVPFVEDMPLGEPENPYGWTKWFIERIIKDECYSDPDMTGIMLRYFNPVGAHESGMIGESPSGRPNNLMPYLTKVAKGTLEKLTVFGDDYPTPDGSCIRDFIHVVDLAKAHVKAVAYAMEHKGYDVFNLGTGHGASVLELIKEFEKVNELKLNYVIGERRAGDIAECYADSSKAGEVLGWHAEKTLSDMCRDAWRWETSEYKKD